MHLILQAAAVEIAARTAREQVEVVFRLLNRAQKAPQHRPSVAEIGQTFRLRSTVRTLFYV